MSIPELENLTPTPASEGRSTGVDENNRTVRCAHETKQLVTAAQIEKNCPDRLQEIAKEVGVRFKKAQKQYQDAVNHIDAIKALMEEARGLCDDGGFKKFREIFCPQLSKSRAYELLAIASNKTSVEESRARTRGRVAKHRTNKAATNSVTVTEKLETDRPSAPTTNDGLDEAAPVVREQAPQPARSQSRIATEDRVLTDFSLRVMTLIHTTNNKDIGRFAKTSVKAGELAQLGKFLIDIADLKKSGATERPPTPPDDGDFPVTDTPLNMKSPDAGVAQGV
jgi:hypothetical protein